MAQLAKPPCAWIALLALGALASCGAGERSAGPAPLVLERTIPLPGATLSSWPTPDLRFNYPVALDPTQRMLAVVFRLPERLRLLDAATGRAKLEAVTCGDADDVFFDARRGAFMKVVSWGHANDAFAHIGAA